MADEDGTAANSLVRARAFVADAVADPDVMGVDALLQRLCRAATTELSMTGCVVHLVTTSGVSGVAATSDIAAARIADLTFTTGDGPSRDAIALRRPVLVPDLSQSASRWQGYAQSAGEAGVRAVFCFPIQVGGVMLGVLHLHDRRPRPFTSQEIVLALAFTQIAADALLGGRPVTGNATWTPLLDHRAEVHQAQGMVMVDLGVDLAEALVRMRAHAFAQGVALSDLAREIIDGARLPVNGAEVAE